MSLEVTVICDGCAAVMGGGKTGTDARQDARDGFGAAASLPGGLDFCGECRKAGKAAGSA